MIGYLKLIVSWLVTLFILSPDLMVKRQLTDNVNYFYSFFFFFLHNDILHTVRKIGVYGLLYMLIH